MTYGPWLQSGLIPKFRHSSLLMKKNRPSAFHSAQSKSNERKEPKNGVNIFELAKSSPKLAIEQLSPKTLLKQTSSVKNLPRKNTYSHTKIEDISKKGVGVLDHARNTVPIARSLLLEAKPLPKKPTEEKKEPHPKQKSSLLSKNTSSDEPSTLISELKRATDTIASLQAARTELEAKLDRYIKEVATLTKLYHTATESSKGYSIQDNQKLEQRLNSCHAELAKLVKMHSKLEAEISNDRKQIKTIQRQNRQLLTGLTSLLRSGTITRRSFDELVCQSSCLFDAEWYLTRYPDVATANLNALQHFTQFGAFEGRDPGPHFSTSNYLRQLPELQSKRINPLVHFFYITAFEDYPL